MTRSSTSIDIRCYTSARFAAGKRRPLRRRGSRGKATRRLSTLRLRHPLAVRSVETTTTDTAVRDVTTAGNLQTCILVGDIGGTNARLSVWKINKGNYTKIYEQWYATKDYKETGFTAVLRDLCGEEEVKQNYPTSACFAIAGPVSNNKAKMTNLGWAIEAAALETEFNWKVALVNDFEALGYGIPLLDASDIVVLNDVPAQEKSPIAVLGPGTGLGQAQLMWDEGRGNYKVWPSEGAHSDFAPRTAKQRALQEWIASGYGYCELEHVACGMGLERIYTFLKSNGHLSVTDEPLLTATN